MTRDEAREAIIAGKLEEVLDAVERGEKAERVVEAAKKWMEAECEAETAPQECQKLHAEMRRMRSIGVKRDET